MAILRTGQSPLGAAYRSRLGVLTLPGEIRMIVCINPGIRVEDDSDFSEDEIREKYEAIRDDLAKTQRVTLEFDERWIKKLAEPPETARVGPRNVLELVFIVGGANPTPFSYFKNYLYEETDEPHYATVSQVTVTGTPLGGPAAGASITRTDGPYSSVAGYKYETDYDPPLSSSLSDDFEEDMGDYEEQFQESGLGRMRLFWDPGPIPPLVERKQSVEMVFAPGSITTNESGFWHGPWGFPGQVLHVWSGRTTRWAYYPPEMYGLVHGERWDCTWPVLTVHPYPPWIQHLTSYTWAPSGIIVDVTGVDQTHDSTDVTESLIEEFIETYGKSEADDEGKRTDYNWEYVGRVDSLTLTASELKSMIPTLLY
jgi:hypothetical protein